MKQKKQFQVKIQIPVTTAGNHQTFFTNSNSSANKLAKGYERVIRRFSEDLATLDEILTPTKTKKLLLLLSILSFILTYIFWVKLMQWISFTKQTIYNMLSSRREGKKESLFPTNPLACVYFAPKGLLTIRFFFLFGLSSSTN